MFGITERPPSASDHALCLTRLPLLITGVTGVAGYNAFHFFQRNYPGQVVGIRPHQSWKMVGEGIVSHDAEDQDGISRLFDRYGFRSVLNCVGNCALKSCELAPDMAERLNVQSARIVAENVRRHEARLVHLSSDLVFSGISHGDYIESDAMDPVSIYGKTMVRAEKVVLDSVPRAAILRIPLPMGPSFNRHAGAIDWIQSRFRGHRPATLYFDEIRSCAYCDDLNGVFEKFLESQTAGIFHCGGPRPISLFEIGQIVNRVGDFRSELLNGCPRHAAGPMPPRAGNVSMNMAKLSSELGADPLQPWPVGTDILPTDRDWHHQRPVDESRSLSDVGKRLYGYPVGDALAVGRSLSAERRIDVQRGNTASDPAM